jgi:hypothetical protein
MDIEYCLLLSENPIYLAGGWGWRRVYIKNLKESGRAHPGRAHPENKKKNNSGRAHPGRAHPENKKKTIQGGPTPPPTL